MATNEKIIKIFIASSIFEFNEERTELVAFEAFLNRTYKDSAIRFEINISDLFSNNLSAIGKQEEYNIEIRNSRFVYFLIGKTLGEYTRQEFRIAKEHFMDTSQPLIYTFFRYDISDPIVDKSVLQFVEEDLNSGQGHYYTPFNHIDTVKLNIISEIARHSDIGGSIGFHDGFAQLNGENAVELKTVPTYQENEGLAELKKQYELLNNEYVEITERLSHDHDFSVVSKAYEIGLQRNSLLEEIEKREKQCFENYIGLLRKSRYGTEINWREKKALEFYENGNYMSGDDLLSDSLWEKEITSMDEIGETIVSAVREYISGRRTLIASLLMRNDNQETAREVIEQFKKAVLYAEKYHVDLDVIYDYAKFLFEQKQYKDSLYLASKLSKYYDLYQEYNELQNYDLNILLGRIHHIYKDHSIAARYYAKAEQNVADSDLEASIKKANLQLYRAQEYLQQHDYTSAERTFKEVCSSISNEGKRKEKEILIEAYRGLGRISNSCNEFEKSVHYYLETEKLCKSIPGHEDDEIIMESLSATYNNLGYLFSGKTDDLEKAEEYYGRSLEIKKRLFNSNPSRWASKYALALCNISSVYLKEGKVVAAVKSAEESYAIRQGLYKMDPDAFGFGFAITCSRLSEAKLHEGSRVDAIRYGEQSVGINEDCYKKNPSACAEEMSIAYRVYAESLVNEDNELAKGNYQKMTDIEKENEWMETKRKETLFLNHLSYARFLLNNGDEQGSKEQYEIALRHISELSVTNNRLDRKRTMLIDEISNTLNEV